MSDDTALATDRDDYAKLIDTALRPSTVDVVIDPTTLDRVFVVHFADREPLALRVQVLELQSILQNISAAVARSLN